MKNKISIWVIISVIFCAFPLYAENLSTDLQKVVLDNGVAIVCKYVPESELVTIQIRVLSGLSNEGEYAGSGISHFLEHLLFKGTHNKTSLELRREIKAMGGMINGSTGLDSAEYHLVVPNKSFEKALDLLVDMVLEPVFTEEEFLLERDVILGEIRMRNDDPLSKRTRLLFEQAYNEHVYRNPVIGNEETFKKLSKEDVRGYHSTVYVPENIVIGIVGGIASETSIKTAGNKLKKCEKRVPEKINVSDEPEQTYEKIAEFTTDVILGYMSIGFHTTDLYSPDLYPTDVLSIALGEGNDSRLYRRLVKEKELLYTVSSVNYTPRYPGLFIISGVGDPDKLEEARQEIFTVIEELKMELIQPAELKRAKKIVISEYLHSQERIKSVVSSITNSDILTGDPAFHEKYVEGINKVKEKEVENVIFKYLVRENSTTVFLLPKDYIKTEDKRSKSEDQSHKTKVTGHQSPVTIHEPLLLSGSRVTSDEPQLLTGHGSRVTSDKRRAPVLERATSDEPRLLSGGTKVVTLENGLRIVVKRRGRLPLVSIAFAAFGGLRAETLENNGISNLTAALTLKGTKNRSESEIVPALERLGGSIGAFSGKNSLGITMDLLAEDVGVGLDIFEDVIKNAIFPEKEIAKHKKKVTASIKEQEKDIFEKGVNQLRKLVYQKHPYSRRISGELETVAVITRDNILTFYEERFVPKDSVITVVGDVDINRTVQDLKKRFSNWKRGGKPVQKTKVIPLEQSRQEEIVMDKEQALLLIGFQGVDLNDKRKYTLSIINSLLSGSDGLLFNTLREQEGLVYTSGAVSGPELDKGYFVLYAATAEENLERVKSVMMNVINKIADGNISNEEIESSKNRILSQYAYSLETNYSVSMIMALDELYGLGYEDHKQYPAKISAVTKNDIVNTAKEILDMTKSVIVVVHSEG